MSRHGFSPDWVSASGDTIADILGERNLSVAEFAQLMGYSQEEVKALLHGYATITIATARRLERTLGASVEFWMSRDFQYWQDAPKFDVTSNEEWIRELPIADMINFGWLKPLPSQSNRVAACLHFFGVPSVSAWRKKYDRLLQMAAFRTTPTFESYPGAVAAWLRQGEIEAEALDCHSWNVQRFKESLSSARPLTREKDPGRFIPELRKRCAEGGVALVVVRAPTGCRASGVTSFLSRRQGLIAAQLPLSVR